MKDNRLTHCGSLYSAALPSIGKASHCIALESALGSLEAEIRRLIRCPHVAVKG